LRADILEGRAPLRENMKLHQVMKQTRQGRTFERQAPCRYAEYGFEYERRRLAAGLLHHYQGHDRSDEECMRQAS
jgi:hypothetical protein